MSKWRWVGVLLVSLSCAGSCWAVEPADGNIKAVMDDLTRFEQQLGSNPSPSTVNRTIKLLELTRKRLESSPNQTHPSWAEAAQRYNELVNRLRSPAAAPAQPAQSTSAPAATPAPAQPAAPAARQLISQDVARLRKLQRDIEGATRTIDQGGVKPFQDPAYAQQQQALADRFRQQLSAYAEFADHPDVQGVDAALQQFERLLAVGLAEGSKSGAGLGDVQGRLAAIYQRVKSPPASPPEPLTAESLEQWIGQLESIRQQAAADQAELAEIKATAHLPLTRGTVEQGAAFDMQNVDSMLAVIDRNLRTLDASLQQLTANLDAQMRQTEKTLDFYDALDPADPEAQKNLFLGEGQMEKGLGALDAEIQRIEAAIALDRRLDRDTLDEREDLLERAQEIRADYIEKREEALQLVRMPEEATDDDDLREVAEEVLENPKYGVGEIQRLVLNTEKSHHRRESSEVEFDDVEVSTSGDVTLTGTETTTIYEWDEFQVATAEPVGDRFFIFYNTLRHFTSGASTTPLNRWVLSSRFQSTEILEENIDPGWW